METVTYKEYAELKLKFMEKHNNDYQIDTSPMSADGSYHKMYAFKDGAGWYECMRPIFEDVDVVVKGLKVHVVVKLLETEFWTSESGSKYYYEKF